MRKFLDSFSWAFFSLAAVPTLLIILSWQSLPGELLFGVKLGLENALIIVAPTYAAKSSLDIIYTEKRFAEATRLLEEKESPVGLPYFTQQLNETKGTILNTPDTKNRKELASAYINRLTDINTELEAQKITFTKVRKSRTTPVVATRHITPTKKENPVNENKQQPTPTALPPSVDATPTPTTSQTEQATGENSIEEEIEDTQDNIDEVIDDLTDALDDEPSVSNDENLNKNDDKTGKNDKKNDKAESGPKMGMDEGMQSPTATPDPTVTISIPNPTSEPQISPEPTATIQLNPTPY